MRVVIGGIEEIDFKELQANTQYEGGYTEETPVIKYLFFYTAISGSFYIHSIMKKRKDFYFLLQEQIECQ